MTREALNAAQEIRERVALSISDSHKAIDASANLMAVQKQLLNESREINALTRASLDARRRFD